MNVSLLYGKKTLHLPEDKKILIICKGDPEESDSYLAQGGICRMQGEEDYESYFADTMKAGHNASISLEVISLPVQSLWKQILFLECPPSRVAESLPSASLAKSTGLNCALHLPEDKKILIICKGDPEESDSYLGIRRNYNVFKLFDRKH